MTCCQGSQCVCFLLFFLTGLYAFYNVNNWVVSVAFAENIYLFQVDKDYSADRPNSSTSTTRDAEDIPDNDDNAEEEDDDDLDIDELNELEASLSRTTLQIREPGDNVWWAAECNSYAHLLLGSFQPLDIA